VCKAEQIFWLSGPAGVCTEKPEIETRVRNLFISRLSLSQFSLNGWIVVEKCQFEKCFS